MQSRSWVYNTNLPPSKQKHHACYDPWISKTYKNLDGYNYTVGYADGSGTSGFVGTDVVNIGGATVTSQAIGLPTYISSRMLRDTDSDGIVGLASHWLNSIQPKQQHTFFDNVRGSLANPVLTANLKANATGFYEFGKIDHSLYHGDLHWVDLIEDGYWKFPSVVFGVGPDQQNLMVNIDPKPAIADTGTSLMLVDAFVHDTYYKAVPNAAKNPNLSNITTYPCDTKLPDFHVALGQKYIATIPGDLMTFADIGNNSEFSPPWGFPSHLEWQHRLYVLPNQNPNANANFSGNFIACYGVLQSNAGLSVQIYGDTLFMSQVAVFNIGNNSVGFAPHADVPGAKGFAP